MSAWESAGQSDEWYTPAWVFDALGERFDLDPCSPGATHWVPADWVFMAKALEKEWIVHETCCGSFVPDATPTNRSATSRRDERCIAKLGGRVGVNRARPNAPDGEWRVDGLTPKRTRRSKSLESNTTNPKKVGIEKGAQALSPTLAEGTGSRGNLSSGPSTLGRGARVTGTIVAPTAAPTENLRRSISSPSQQRISLEPYHGTCCPPVENATIPNETLDPKISSRTPLALNGLCNICRRRESRSAFVFMNPPFGGRNGLVPWLDKFFEHGNGIALAPDRTSAPWWQDAARRADAVFFFRGKIKFERPDGSVGKHPGHGTTLFAAGKRAEIALSRLKPEMGILLW